MRLPRLKSPDGNLPNTITVLSGAGDGGHRREYTVLFKRLFERAALSVRIENIRPGQVFSHGALISLIVEDHTLPFLMLAIVRALLGRTTVGLLFMPRPCLRPKDARLHLKRALLQLCRKFTRISILTLLPFTIEPAMAEIARGWIYDPQFWDLDKHSLINRAETPISKSIVGYAVGRPIILLLGGLTYIKGFSRFSHLPKATGGRFVFLAAGQLDSSMAQEADTFVASGGILENRMLSDQEMLSLYRVASFVWACYAPEYDQSSGIFGRAVQLGVPALVREGSLVARIANELSHPIGVLPWQNQAALADALLKLATTPHTPRAGDELRAISLENLSRALGVDLQQPRKNINLGSTEGTNA